MPSSRTAHEKMPMDPADLLLDLLKLAREEGALEGSDLEAFVAALRERAGLVVAERIRRLQDQVTALERQEGVLKEELAWRREEAQKLKEAHDRLLAHHRDALTRLAAELSESARIPFYRPRLLRQRLRALADSLRHDAS